MFFKVLTFFAMLAVAFANPQPRAQPNPQPQVVAYSAPGVVPAVGYSGYAPVAYSAPYSAQYASVPYAYSGYYVR